MRAKEKIQVAVFCSGFGSNLEALLKAEKRGQLGAHISLVVCDRVKAAAIQRALKHKRAVFCAEPKHYKNRLSYEKAVWNILKQKKIGLVVLAGFMRILTPYLIRAMKGRMVNVHPSLLPEFKGAHAIKDAFDAGVKKTGVTVHWVTPQLDSGPIILQEEVKVSPRDSLKSLEKKIHKVEHRLYPKAIRLVATRKAKK